MGDTKDLHRLRRIKTTCVGCGNVRHFTRAEVRPIWKWIEEKFEMPVTWDLACPSDSCEGAVVHFLDWPDPRVKKA